MAAGGALPTKGNLFLSVKDTDKPLAAELAKEYVALGFKVFATAGTHAAIVAGGGAAERINKLSRVGPTSST